MTKIKTMALGKKIVSLLACMLIACLGVGVAFADTSSDYAQSVVTPSTTGVSMATTSVEGLVLDKTATANGDGTYTIALEAYTTGSVSTVAPCDIVLVLDWSGSMGYSFDGSQNLGGGNPNSRAQALNSAVFAFIDVIAEDAQENNLSHAIGVVSFGPENSDGTNATVMSELAYVDAENKLLKDSATATGMYGKHPVGDQTHIDDGLAKAEVMLSSSGSQDGDRNKIVVVFTDGAPGNSTDNNWATDGDEVADAAIKHANDIKNKHNATIYTVGVVAGANPEAGLSGDGSFLDLVNKFLHYLSSNFPCATSMNEAGEGGGIARGYYLSASNADDLKGKFENIATNIVASADIELSETSVVCDVVTRYFDMPAGTDSVTVQTVECLSYNESTGAATWSSDPSATVNLPASSVTIDGKTVKVTGFDFDKNFLRGVGTQEDGTGSGDFRGRKLVISFNVTAKDEFWGGNNVPTNEVAGVYEVGADGKLGDPVGIFEVPEVNVPLNLPDSISTSADIYLLGEAPDISRLVVPSGDDAWKIDYVNVVSDSGSSSVSNTQDTIVNMTIGVSAKYDGAGASGTPATGTVERSATTSVNVYKPSITFKDTLVDAGTELADYSENYVDVKWTHGNTKADVAVMGAAPELAYSYNPAAGAINQDTPVKVSVSMEPADGSGSTDVTQYASFYRSECEACDDCDFAGGQVDATADNRVNFIVHAMPWISVDITKVVEIQNWANMTDEARGRAMTNNVVATFGLFAEGETDPIATQEVTVAATTMDDLPSASTTFVVKNRSLKLNETYVVKEISANTFTDYSLYETTYTHGSSTGTNPVGITLTSSAQEEQITCTNKYKPTISVLPTLTIVKNLPTKPESDESFLFRVVGVDSGNTVVSSNVVLNGSDFSPVADGGYTASILVSALPEGSYTVTEVTDWSWRYKLAAENGVLVSGVTSNQPVANGSSFALDKKSEATVAFSNVADDDSWLTFTDWCENLFTDNGIVRLDPAENK